MYNTKITYLLSFLRDIQFYVVELLSNQLQCYIYIFSHSYESGHIQQRTILAPEILGNRNIKSRIRRFDWLLESLESSVVIGCFV